MQVANCTTPANYFHVLRRQLNRGFPQAAHPDDAEVAAAPQARGVWLERSSSRLRSTACCRTTPTVPRRSPLPPASGEGTGGAIELACRTTDAPRRVHGREFVRPLRTEKRASTTYLLGSGQALVPDQGAGRRAVALQAGRSWCRRSRATWAPGSSWTPSCRGCSTRSAPHDAHATPGRPASASTAVGQMSKRFAQLEQFLDEAFRSSDRRYIVAGCLPAIGVSVHGLRRGCPARGRHDDEGKAVMAEIACHARRVGDRGDHRQVVQAGWRCRRGRRAAGRARDRQGHDRGAARRPACSADRREGRRDGHGRRTARPDQGRRRRRAPRPPRLREAAAPKPPEPQAQSRPARRGEAAEHAQGRARPRRPQCQCRPRCASSRPDRHRIRPRSKAPACTARSPRATCSPRSSVPPRSRRLLRGLPAAVQVQRLAGRRRRARSACA